MKKNIILLSVLAVALLGCQNEPIAPRSEQDAQLQKTHSIADFLAQYMSEAGDYQPVRTRATNDNVTYLFSIDSIPTAGSDIVIEGRVISDDAAGNLYKLLVIQDIDDPKQSLRIGVDAGSIGGLYQLGQVVRIRCNGLAVGKYADEPQLCVASYNNNRYATNAEQKVGWMPGRIPFPRFQSATEMVGMPDVSKVVEQVTTIPEIYSHTGRANGQQEWQSRLVKIENVHFTNEQWTQQGAAEQCIDADPSRNTNASVFAPTTENVGYPQGRLVADVNGNKIAISTSEYADFARVKLPPSDVTFTVIGILGYYRDQARFGDQNKNWQISIRSLDDLIVTSGSWTPEEWTAQ